MYIFLLSELRYATKHIMKEEGVRVKNKEALIHTISMAVITLSVAVLTTVTVIILVKEYF